MIGRRLLVLALIGVFIRCSDDKSAGSSATPIRPAKKKKVEATKAEADTALAPSSEPYHYSPIGKRDPFRPYFLDEQAADADKADEHLTELQRYEIDQLKLVGILSATSQPQAMFEDPQGVGWPVTVGTLMGRNGGRVHKISKDEVVILEEYRDAAGKKVMNPITLKLPGDELAVDK